MIVQPVNRNVDAPRHRVCRLTALLGVSTCLLTPPLQAGDILGGRLYTVPETLYVNQPFELRFDLEITAGSNLDDLRIRDFPNDPAIMTVGTLASASRHRVTRDGKAMDVFQYVAHARCHQPLKRTITPTVQGMLVERRTSGFFSHWQSFPKQHRLPPFTLQIRALPTADQPASFSGAVGVFSLRGDLSHTQARPGDILTLTLTLSGKGWLGDATPPQPNVSEHFKTYPVKTTLNEALRRQTRQILIPQSTQAVEVAAVRFTYFNPQTERYESTVAGPFPLTVHESAISDSHTDIRLIDTGSQPPISRTTQKIVIHRVNQTMRRTFPLLIGSASALLAFFAFFLLRARHPRAAWIPGVLLLLAGSAGALFSARRAPMPHHAVSQPCDARFAPARRAARLFSLSPGDTVTVLEHVGDWVRVDADGDRGWILSEHVQSSREPKPAEAAPTP